jgi:hypothetical protein
MHRGYDTGGSKACPRTSEVGRQDSLKVDWIHGAKRLCSEKHLLQRIPRLAEVEQK